MTDPASRLNAALADRYRILDRLGEGGMATVYLAEDLKHKRQVAVKVLKPELAAVLGAERFVQEITTTASLQHPHILPLFDSGEADGFLYYVMPYIEGETLRNKLDRETQLSIDEAVRITTEVGDALDYAHRHGVIHRDIKPENILLHDGRPMVADFGIALAVSAAAGGRMTETGLSLGTPHYMSPEQATAEKEITARSDVYSLGSVMYEMLTGDPPHTASSAQAIIMKIVTEEAAPVTRVRKAAPANVAAAVARSLAKLPADRFATASEFVAAIQNPNFGATALGSQPGAVIASRTSGPSWLSLTVALAVGIVAGVVAMMWLNPDEEAAPSRQQVVLWQHPIENFLSPGVERIATQAAIAPDGSTIVFADSVDQDIMLFRKRRADGVPVALSGTEGGLSPFFSPDGRWVGYITVDGQLRKIPVEGGSSLTIAEDANITYQSATWLEDNTIVYVSSVGWDLQRVPADGGESISLEDEDGTRDLGTARFVHALPGSRGLLLTYCANNCAVSSSIMVLDLGTDQTREIVPDAAGAWYSPTGHLLYTDRSGGLFARGFDLDKLEVTTGAIPIIPGVAPTSFALSASGTALYSIGSTGLSELVWVTRDGRATPIDSSWRGNFQYPALNPDGGDLAVSLGQSDGSTQLWILRADGRRQQLTQEGTVNWRPTWILQGREIAFLSHRSRGINSDDYDAYRMPVDGSSPPQLLLDHGYGLWEVEFTPDAAWQVFRADEDGSANIYGRHQGDTALVPLVFNEGNGSQISLSPDGQWLAYTFAGSGVREIYLSPFPSMSTRLLISQNGGTEPRWARSGRELFYKSGNQLMVVDMTPGRTLMPGTPRVLFSLQGYRAARNRQQYDVSSDDSRFVMIRELDTSVETQVIYVENWLEELTAKINR